MSKVNITYDEHRGWGRPSFEQDYRPYEEIIVRGPVTYERLWCLVDTGADDLQIHYDVAKKVGINLRMQGISKVMQTASGGTVTLTEVSNVAVEIEGFVIKVNCLFGFNSIPILGRNAILKALDFGFDVKGWLLKV